MIFHHASFGRACRLPAVLFAVLLAAACGHAGIGVDRPAIPARPGALEYIHWLRTAAPEALRAEHVFLKQNSRNLDPVVQSVSLALLLSVRAQEADNEARALELLDALPPADAAAAGAQGTYAGYLVLGLFWREVLQERRRLRAATAATARSLKGAQEQAQSIRSQLKVLQEQIEALKEIEIEQQKARSATGIEAGP
jgi:hypothetical protein